MAENEKIRVKDGRPRLETEIDELYRFIKDKKTVRVSAAAKKFKVPKNIIEEWGHILEEHDSIRLHYPIIGEPVLKIAGYKKVRTKKQKKLGFVLALIVLCIVLIYILLNFLAKRTYLSVYLILILIIIEVILLGLKHKHKIKKK